MGRLLLPLALFLVGAALIRFELVSAREQPAGRLEGASPAELREAIRAARHGRPDEPGLDVLLEQLADQRTRAGDPAAAGGWRVLAHHRFALGDPAALAALDRAVEAAPSGNPLATLPFLLGAERLGAALGRDAAVSRARGAREATLRRARVEDWAALPGVLRAMELDPTLLDDALPALVAERLATLRPTPARRLADGALAFWATAWLRDRPGESDAPHYGERVQALLAPFVRAGRGDEAYAVADRALWHVRRTDDSAALGSVASDTFAALIDAPEAAWRLYETWGVPRERDSEFQRAAGMRLRTPDGRSCADYFEYTARWLTGPDVVRIPGTLESMENTARILRERGCFMHALRIERLRSEHAGERS